VSAQVKGWASTIALPPRKFAQMAAPPLRKKEQDECPADPEKPVRLLPAIE